MTSPLVRARELRAAAKKLYEDTGLIDLLARHGEVTLIGSYVYDLMTWRDVDLCVAVDPVELSVAFEIGHEIAAIEGVGKLIFRNEHVLDTPGNPRGMIWCATVRDADGENWKVDLLIAEPSEVARVVAPGQRVMAELTEETRAAILEIKTAVGSGVAGTAVYDAVLHHGVRTVEEFRAHREARPKS
jgi:hypothetical protein